MVSEQLDFRHKDLLYERLKNIDIPISEYTFPNAYLFREVHRYEVIFDREIFLKGITYDGRTYLMPTVPLKNIDTDNLKDLMRGVDLLFPIPEAWLPFLEKEEFDVFFKEGDADYLYTVNKMSIYPGRYLHRKRNLLKQFVTGYSHEEMPLTNERTEHAMYILDEWQKENDSEAGETDFHPCREALKRYDELVLCGGIYYADGEPAGFIVGEELNAETFVLHFAKARKKFRGVYQYMFNSFARVLPEKYHYLNLEQDLDREALRIAKSSYIPDVMLKKARVSLKKG
jgi:uncharacterized protein